nr:hypothetical protein [Tanacetum cinerariifolium]
VVHAGSDREHIDLDVADVSPQPSTKKMDEGLLQWLTRSDKPSDADNDKANAKTEVESMVSVPIQQDMSSIPPMTSPIIDLTSRPESPKLQHYQGLVQPGLQIVHQGLIQPGLHLEYQRLLVLRNLASSASSSRHRASTAV